MGRKTKRGATSKPIKPTMKERSVFELRGGGGNMNPYAKMADKGLINPLQMELTRRKKKKGTPSNAKDKAGKKGLSGKAEAGVLGLGMSLPLIVKRVVDARKGNIPD